MIHDGVAGVAQPESVVTGCVQAGTDADMLEYPVLGEIHRRLDCLVLVRRFVGDQAPDGDATGRRLAGDGHVAVGEVNLGVDESADFEEDVLGAGLVDGPLQRARTGGVEVGDVDDAAPATSGGVGPEALRTGERRQRSSRIGQGTDRNRDGDGRCPTVAVGDGDIE